MLNNFTAYLKCEDPEAALRCFGQFRILCAVRNGPLGVENINRLVEEILADAGLIEAGGNYHAGRPLLITRNDYNLRLFNGDIGVLLQDAKRGELRAYFSGPEESLRDFLPLRLPVHETAYAMTVHKSQGSEFERVLMILPGEDSAILTRELIYTGLTRASKQVELWTDREALPDDDPAENRPKVRAAGRLVEMSFRRDRLNMGTNRTGPKKDGALYLLFRMRH